jgi:hypothetical protein
MKTTLQLVSLLAVCGYAAAQFAGSLGVQIPSEVNASNAVIVLTFACVALIVLGDYGPKRGLSRRGIRQPSTEIAGAIAIRRSPRHGYSIRRGAEAARLAAPSAVIRFPTPPRMPSHRVA